ncbi:hypothetical protein K439DRAFT_1642316 [Ramaria rubella]|nr:hypothetical protein K439DRAFT_1642316 [Ramaria rubella]
MEPTATLPSWIEAEDGLTSCHEFVVHQRHYRRRRFVAQALNGAMRDVHILHPSASRAEHTLGLYYTCRYYC